jgi:hypothetical protein
MSRLIDLYQMHEPEPERARTPSEYGEIFICTEETLGGIEELVHFRGKMVSSLGGGGRKTFVLEENREQLVVVSALHPAEFDDYECTFDSELIALGLEEIVSCFEEKGKVVRITCGKNHTVVLLEDGSLYTFGRGEYGVLGHGSCTHEQVPRLISKLGRL